MRGGKQLDLAERGKSVLGAFILIFLFYRRQGFVNVFKLESYLRHGACTWRHKDLQENRQNLDVQYPGWRSNKVFTVVVQSLSRVQLFVTPCQPSLSFTISRRLLKLMSIESVMPSNHLILCHPLLPPSVFPASGSLPTSWLLASGGRSPGASASVLPVNI